MKFDLDALNIPTLHESFLLSPEEAAMFDDDVTNPAMTHFRDLLSVTWMLHVRDKLSLALRGKLALAEKIVRCQTFVSVLAVLIILLLISDFLFKIPVLVNGLQLTSDYE